MNTQRIRQFLPATAVVCLALYLPILLGVFYTAATMHISYNASTAGFVPIAPGLLLTWGLPILAGLRVGSPGVPGLVLSTVVTLALIALAVKYATRSRNAFAWTTLGTFGFSSLLSVVFVMLQKM